jgi:hypothetical protein
MLNKKELDMQDFEVLPVGTTQHVKDLELQLYVLRKCRNPHQPIEKDAHGVSRFKSNKIVEHLLNFSSSKGCGMNQLTRMYFSNEDWRQFAQLIGYSVSGYNSTSYVIEETEITE